MDLAMLAGAAGALALFPAAHAGMPSVLWSAVFGLAVIAVLGNRAAYSGRLQIRLLDDVRRVLFATLMAAMGVISIRVLLTGEGVVANETATLAAYAFAFVAAGRIGASSALSRGLLEGQIRRPTLILGAGKVGNLTAQRLLSEPDHGLWPAGFIDDDPLDTPGEPPVLPVLGGPPDLDRIVAEHNIEHLIVGFSMASHQLMLGLVRRCWELGVSVSLVPRLFEVEGNRATVDRLGGLPLVSLSAPETSGLGLALKYSLDRVVAAITLALLFPLMAAIAIAIRLSMGGPIFFAQHRVGRDGQHFAMWKFRTMAGSPGQSGEADARWAEEMVARNSRKGLREVPAIESDRRTPLGRFLRRSSLDELPQLWNVLVGQMSLIGPRPERIHYVEKFEEVIYRYGDRHRVKSGMTGWAQVSGLRGDTSLQDRVEWDNYYIENWSLWLDVKIALKTVTHVFNDVSGRRAPSVTNGPERVPAPTRDVG
ncbi:MAG: sugar transferase [Thermoleophilaceae bacterium]|nr:sugar transferase [Thermoleophilaceae bacterium]